MRKIETQDYETLTTWWKKWDFPPPPQHILPPTGFIVENLAAGFLYLTDAPIGWMEWIVCNPDAEKTERSSAIDAVIMKLDEKAKENGKILNFTTTNAPSYESRLKRLGYLIGDTNTTQLMRRL